MTLYMVQRLGFLRPPTDSLREHEAATGARESAGDSYPQQDSGPPAEK